MCVITQEATPKLRRKSQTYILWNCPTLVLQGDIWRDSLKSVGNSVPPSFSQFNRLSNELSCPIEKKAHLKPSRIQAVYILIRLYSKLIKHQLGTQNAGKNSLDRAIVQARSISAVNLIPASRFQARLVISSTFLDFQEYGMSPQTGYAQLYLFYQTVHVSLGYRIACADGKQADPAATNDIDSATRRSVSLS